jgi:hypothetical protein
MKNNKITHIKKRSTSRQTVQIAAWVRQPIKEKIQHLAKLNGMSESRVIGSLIEQALSNTFDEWYGARVRPIIENAINKRMNARDARFAALIVRAVYDAGQTRQIVCNILSRMPKLTPEQCETIIKESAKNSRLNIINRSPQIDELIKAIQKWMAEVDAENEK